MKKEKLIEIAEKLASTTEEFNMYIAGAKWQQEQVVEQDDSSLKLLQVMELVELALQKDSIHPSSFIIRNAVRECIGLEPIK